MSSRSKNVIQEFEAYPEESYRDIDLTGLAAFTILRLNDLHIPNTFENLVVALFKLFPIKFSLVGFDQYPDAARVNRTLLQLGPKYRNWARGSVQKGFVLTEAGNLKVANVAKIISGNRTVEPQRARQPALSRTMDLSKDIQAIEQSSLYQNWKTNGEIKNSDSIALYDLLGAYAYTPPRVLLDRMKLLRTIVTQLGRTDILQFLDAVESEFARQLRA
jgi:hypothetical protein